MTALQTRERRDSSLVHLLHIVNGWSSVPVDVEGPEVGLVAEQDLGILAVGQIHPHHLLKLGVQVVEPALHHRQRHRLGDH